ncbi:hypothetical protein LguiA_018118 [Lonicera macranthoides]
MKKETHSKKRATSNGYKHHHHHHHHHHHNQNIHHTTTTFLPLLCKASAHDIKVKQVVLPKFSGDPSSPRVSCIGHVKRSNKVTGFPTQPSRPTNTAAAATTPGSSRRPIPNSIYSHSRPAALTHKPRLKKSNSASPPPLTTTATLGGCGPARSPILNPNYSALVAGLIYKTTSNKPIPSPRTPTAAAIATTGTTGVHRPASGPILNCNYSALRAGSWISLNTTTAAAAAAGKSNFKYTKLKVPYFCKNISEPINGSSCRSRDMKMMNCTIRRSGDFTDGSDRNYDVELDRPLPVVKKIKEPGFDRDEVNLWKRRSNGFELKSNLKIQQIHLSNYNHHHSPTTV